MTNKKGEISYFNGDTGAVSNEHPLDDYYRELYKREKAKKLGGGGFEDARVQQVLD